MVLKFPEAAGRGGRHLPCRLRSRGLGRRARQQSVDRPHHRTAAGPADLPLHRDAALSGRTAVDAAGAPAGGGSGGGPQYRDQAGARRGGAAPRRHHPSRHQAGQRDPRERRIAQADRSRRGARARPRGFPAGGYSGHAGLHGAGNVGRRTGQRSRPTFTRSASPCSAPSPANSLTAISMPSARRAAPGRSRSAELRPDLPAWLQAALGRAIALDPNERFRDMNEFAMEMEAGPGARARSRAARPLTLYERSPVALLAGRRRAAGAGARDFAAAAALRLNLDA